MEKDGVISGASMMPVRGILLVLAVWLVHTVHATGDAVCPSDGTLIAFGGAPDTNAAIGMDAGGDYAIFPEGVTVGREFWMDAQNSAAPHFARDGTTSLDGSCSRALALTMRSCDRCRLAQLNVHWSLALGWARRFGGVA